TNNETKSEDFNPITNQGIELELPKRTRVFNEEIEVENTTEEVQAPSNLEVFDIDTAFKRLKVKSNRDVNYDTQLAIINDIFSDNLVEYNSTQQLYLDSITDKIMISEEELTKILDEKESALRNAQLDSTPKEKRSFKRVNHLFSDTKKIIKPKKSVESVVEENFDLGYEEVIDLNQMINKVDEVIIEEVKVEEVIKENIPLQTKELVNENRSPLIEQPPLVKSDGQSELEEKVHLFMDDEDDKYDFSNLNNNKSSIIFVVVIIGLVLVLGYLVYTYLLK
ncbi:MAG: hypothetical protein ACRCTA_01645, partial [Bacilli bacterium]